MIIDLRKEGIQIIFISKKYRKITSITHMDG